MGYSYEQIKPLIKKEELERVRAQLLETQERNLIEKAKREEEIKTIEDDELREKLQMEIDELRNKSLTSVLGDNSKMREMALTLKRLAKIAEKENRFNVG